MANAFIDAMKSSCQKGLLGVALLLVATTQLAYPQQSQPEPGSSLVTIRFQSKLVQKELPYIVVLPRDYETAKNKQMEYPVLYLLHGLWGHYTDWTSRTKLTEYAAQHRMVIVTPEGNDGWYTDSATNATEKYETYIVQELIPDVEKRFRVSKERDGRAIAGLSMGGYGAFKFAVKYPDKFVFAASMSGALDAVTWNAKDMVGLEAILKTLSPVFGEAGSQTRLKNDLTRLYGDASENSLSQLPYFYLDCGTEDTFLRSTQNLSDLLLKRKIRHELRLLPGNHGWVYWNQQIPEVLQVASRHLKPPR
jgi:putative tributyrin esterase